MKTKTKIKTSVFSMSWLNKAIYTSMVLLGAIYIFSVNSMSSQGYILQDLKGKLNDLNIKNDENELRVMSLESLPNISTRAKQLKMVKANKIEYINDTTVFVAKK
jgi:hypothetical protein